ncbi:hypothetical protein RintRC_7220 [Richelia intracellularis]|nr:hypothetical protein RintRC_7220 [Richelia intracellularis]
MVFITKVTLTISFLSREHRYPSGTRDEAFAANFREFLLGQVFAYLP